jgi:hypothetical protein
MFTRQKENTNFRPPHGYTFRSTNHHYPATNTKPQTKVKCNTSLFTVWDRMISQKLLKHKGHPCTATEALYRPYGP